MQDGCAMPALEAGSWLREHFRGHPAPQVSITWEVAEPNDAVYHEVLGILFGPEGDSAAA